MSNGLMQHTVKYYRPIALTSQVSSRCSLTISVQVQQPHTAQLTILIQNYYKLLQNLLCLQKYIMHRLLICPPDASSPAL